MKMAPIYNSQGQLTGHVDLAMCIQARDHILVDEQAAKLYSECSPDKYQPTESRFYRLTLRQLVFRHEYHGEQRVRCLVTDDPPSWFWGCHAVVKFEPGSFQEVR